ncbi:MAG: Omp28 family outer membrane lipoprotein [Flavobacteriales bacterium]
MKSILKLSLFLTISAIAFSSCDTVENNDYVNNVNVDSRCFDDVFTFPAPPADVKRNVLIEEFTGHKCGNCPDAAIKLKEILSNPTYADRVIGMAVHGGVDYFNEFTPGADRYFYDFNTAHGKAYVSEFGISGLPSSTLNRQSSNGGNVELVAYTKWEENIDAYLNQSPVAWVDIHAKYNEDQDKLLCIQTRVKFLEAYNKPVNLTLAIVENGIVNWQTDYPPSGVTADQNIPDYEHNHVLRSNDNPDMDLYGAWGTGLGLTFDSSYDKVKYASTSLEGMDWVPENLSVIAYIYDADTKEVLQVNEVHVE